MRNLFRRLHHGMTLEAKLIGPMVLIVLLGSAVGTVLTYVSLRREITQQYVEQARAAALILERGGRAEDLLKDRGAVSSHLNELMDMHRVSHRVTIYARTHMGYRAVASTDPLRVGREAALHDLLPLGTGQPVFREEIEDGLPVLEIVLPVRQGGRIVATVGVYVPLAERNARLAGVIRSRVAVSILVGGTLVGLVFAIIRASVLTPLGTLMRAAERTAAGDLTADAILRGNATPPEGVPRDQVARFARVLGSLVRQIREAQARLEEQATRDPLTGLHNRRYFEEISRSAVAVAERYREPFSVAVIDVDGLREVNNRLGHLAGDARLRLAAKFLRDEARAADEVIRWGGDTP